MTDIENRLQTIFREVLNQDDFTVKRSLSASDVEGWDSFAHIRLIVAIEKEFKVKFTTPEISGLQDLGGMIDLLGRKLG